MMLANFSGTVWTNFISFTLAIQEEFYGALETRFYPTMMEDCMSFKVGLPIVLLLSFPKNNGLK